MSRPVRGRGRSGAAAALAIAAVALVGGRGGVAAAAERSPARPVATCRAVGDRARPMPPGRAAVSHHATVVVDTGDGVVWAACISFDGVVSGRDALDLAATQIPDLNPTFDTYGGLGAAVCELRGVGRPPPGCLSGGADYWGYWRNGRYSGAGASSTTVRDGDIEGWRWGRGTAPGAPTDGSICSRPPPPPTTSPPATAPPTTAPPLVAGTVPGGGPVGTPAPTAPSGSGSPTTVAGGSVPTTVSGAPTSVPTTGPATGPTAGPGTSVSGDGLPVGSANGHARPAGGSEQAIRVAAHRAAAHGSAGSRSKGQTASLAGFGAALALIIGLAVVARRRRSAVSSP